MAEGNPRDVAYAFALFWAPPSVLISLVTVVLLITVIDVLLLAALAAFVLNLIVAAILG